MQAFDLRKARRWDPRQVSPLIVDTNRFNRNLLAEIMRTIGVMGLELARDKEDAMRTPLRNPQYQHRNGGVVRPQRNGRTGICQKRPRTER